MTSYENALNLVGHYFLGYRKEHIPNCLKITVPIIYAVIFLVIGAWTLYRISNKTIKHDKYTENTYEFIERIMKTHRRHKILRILRSLGLILIYDFFLSKQGVMIYDHFNRPSIWEKEPKMLDRIDRYICENESIEFQYSRDYLYIQYRLATGNEKIRKFGDPIITTWKKIPKRYIYLILLSRTGFVWILIHFLKHFMIKIISILLQIFLFIFYK